jgi:hypothetical protein
MSPMTEGWSACSADSLLGDVRRETVDILANQPDGFVGSGKCNFVSPFFGSWFVGFGEGYSCMCSCFIIIMRGRGWIDGASLGVSVFPAVGVVMAAS